LVFGTFSDPLLAGTFWFGAGVLATTLVLLVATALMRVRLLARLARERAAAQLWNPLFAECTERVPDVLPRPRRRDAEFLLVLWCKAQESLRGEAQERLRTMAERVGVTLDALRLLSKGNARLKLIALVSVGHLREPRAVPLLLRLIAHPSALVSMTAAQALLRVDEISLAVPRVLAETVRRSDWALAKLVAMLVECDPEKVGPLLAAAIRTRLHAPRQDPGSGGLARLLRLHVCVNPQAVREAVLEVLRSVQQAQPLVAALDALWHPEDAGHARRLLGHEEWTVREAAARALGRAGGREDFARLCAALADRNRPVRYAAAQALCALPEIDVAELSALPGRLDDRYAADMLRHALAEQSAP